MNEIIKCMLSENMKTFQKSDQKFASGRIFIILFWSGRDFLNPVIKTSVLKRYDIIVQLCQSQS